LDGKERSTEQDELRCSSLHAKNGREKSGAAMPMRFGLNGAPGAQGGVEVAPVPRDLSLSSFS
jgi:hypothetical protein